MSQELVLERSDLQNMFKQAVGNTSPNGGLVPHKSQQMVRVDAKDLMHVLMELSGSVAANAQSTMNGCMAHLERTGQGVDVIEEFEIFLEEY